MDILPEPDEDVLKDAAELRDPIEAVEESERNDREWNDQ